MNSKSSTLPWKENLSRGFKAAVPIALGYIPIGMAFGLLAKSSGIPDFVAMLMSFIVFAGASQFVGISLIALGTNPWEVVLTTFILNLRHLLMSASLSRRIETHTSLAWRSILAFGVTDETFSMASLQKDSHLSQYFLLALNFLAFFAWNVGTWIGLFLASGLPESVQASMGIALYAMFIGLLIPALKGSVPVLVVVVISITVHSLLCWTSLTADFSTGWKLIISAILAALAAAWIYPEGVGRNE